MPWAMASLIQAVVIIMTSFVSEKVPANDGAVFDDPDHTRPAPDRPSGTPSTVTGQVINPRVICRHLLAFME